MVGGRACVQSVCSHWSIRSIRVIVSYASHSYTSIQPITCRRPVDKCGDFITNEVAIDYNAGFQGAVAGLKQLSAQGLLGDAK